eukprot:7000134-Pyramimonas_sp.AAC.1
MSFQTRADTQEHSRRKQSRWHQRPAMTCTSFLLTVEHRRCTVSWATSPALAGGATARPYRPSTQAPSRWQRLALAPFFSLRG